MHEHRKILLAVWLPVLLAWTSVMSFGQINTSTLTGIVTDPSGAVIPGAQVLLQNTETNTSNTTVADTAGRYLFAGIPLGNYTLTVTHPGFQTVVREGVQVFAGANLAVDITMTLGQVSQKVDVKGVAPILETRDTTYTQSIDTSTLNQLPLALTGWKRDPNQYMTAVPGYQGSAGFSNEINGALGGQSEVMIDGAPNEDTMTLPGLFRQTMSVEAIGEFKISMTPTADLPNNGGAVMSYTIKSGTNALHGAAYDYTRNSSLDSRCWFCTVVTTDHQSEFGFNLGGPIYIPHVINGKNKLFFFTNLSWSRYAYGIAASELTFPTQDMRGGNFSALLGSQIVNSDGSGALDELGRPVFQGEIYDPTSTRQVVAGQVDPITGLTALQSGTIRDPFPNNTIPQGQLSAVSQTYQSYYPLPTSSGLSNNWLEAGGEGTQNEATWTQKVDYYHGKHHIAGTFWWDNTPSNVPFVLPTIAATQAQASTYGKDSRLNWSMAISPTTVNDVVIGEVRFINDTVSLGDALKGPQLLGIPNTVHCTPGISIPGFNVGNGANCGYLQHQGNYSIFETLSHVKGRHYLKLGGDAVAIYNNDSGNVGTNFNFSHGETALPGNYFNPTGIAYASFLLGEVDNASYSATTTVGIRYKQYGLFATDEFHATRKLTVTVGLRWDGQTVPYLTGNNFTAFDPTVPNAAAGGLPGALVFMGFGTGLVGKRNVVPNNFTARSFGPRLGLAYQLSNKTVLRAGYAMLYSPVAYGSAGYQVLWQQGYIPGGSVGSTDGFTPIFNWAHGYPYPANAFALNFDPTQDNGGTAYYNGLDAGKAPRIQEFTFGFQHELAGGIRLSAFYNGNNGHGLYGSGQQNINQLNFAEYGSLGNELSDDISQTTLPLPYPGFTGSVAQALRPFPQFLNVLNYTSTRDYSTYNAFQLQLQKHFSDGLSFMVGYTIEKQLTSVGAQPGFFADGDQNSYDMRAEKSLADADIPQQLLFNYTYELPFGPGKKYMNNSNPIAKYLTGGWSIAGIHTYQSGGPFGLTSETALPTTTIALRPDRVQSVPVRSSVGCGNFNPATDLYLNSGAFALPPAWQFGDTSRTLGDLRWCALVNENFTLFKSVPLKTERAKLTIGADFFDVFNRHQWCGPTNDIQSTAFGQIGCTANGPRLVQLHARIQW